MKTPHSLNKVDVMILCGGLGTRLRSVVSDRQKTMAEVHDKPFLEVVVRGLLKQGFKRIIFCTGYMGEHIDDYFKNRSYPEGVTFVFSREEKPLGTGGAVKNALHLIKSEHFFVVNGDTASDLNFRDFYLSHVEKQMPLSIALVGRRDGDDYGNVILVRNNEIASFVEKDKKEPSGLVSAGCYVMNESIKDHFPTKDIFSLEHDVFPRLVGKSHGFVFDGKFLDIGTPDRLISAKALFS